VAQTNHERNVYEDHGAPAERVKLVPLCVDPAAFSGLPKRGTFRRGHEIPEQSALVLCVARLHSVKGIDTLIDAFSKIGQSDKPWLAIVGWDHGALRSLQAKVGTLQIQDRVRFCGPLYGDERWAAYVDADVFALTPRVYEETSLAALEAAGCGVPTVLTRECETPGLVEAGGGVMVDRDPDGVAAAIEALLGDEPRRRLMGGAARSHIFSEFSVQQVVAQHEALFIEARN
jgi:glycosyltransferase involved in cell wall biosynthesis